MQLKFIKTLTVAAVINIFLGVFLVITGVFKIKTNNDFGVQGIQLSTLVATSGAFALLSGLLSFFARKDIQTINIQLLTALVALACPIFFSIALFFWHNQHIICIRLLPTLLSTALITIAVLMVKLKNESMKKKKTFNPTAMLNSNKKRKSVNLGKIFSSNSKKKSVNIVGVMQKSPEKMHSKNIISSRSKITHASGKRKSGLSLGKGIYSGKRHSSFRLKRK